MGSRDRVYVAGPEPGTGAAPRLENTAHPPAFWVISRFHNYLIYYEAGQDTVSIERVLDGRRDVRRIVEEA
jgi:plasmid stabilization system protein ParE